jgi:hypothetical protein
MHHYDQAPVPAMTASLPGRLVHPADSHSRLAQRCANAALTAAAAFTRPQPNNSGGRRLIFPWRVVQSPRRPALQLRGVIVSIFRTLRRAIGLTEPLRRQRRQRASAATCRQRPCHSSLYTDCPGCNVPLTCCRRHDPNPVDRSTSGDRCCSARTAASAHRRWYMRASGARAGDSQRSCSRVAVEATPVRRLKDVFSNSDTHAAKSVTDDRRAAHSGADASLDAAVETGSPTC